MSFPWGSVVSLLITVLATTSVWGQETTSVPQPDDSVGVRGDPFTKFDELDDNVDKFQSNTQEYLIVDDKATYKQAKFACKEYNADLSVIETDELARFIAEALSETRLVLDTLWVAGRKNLTNDSNLWYWEKFDGSTPVLVEEIDKLFISKELMQIDATDRNCLTFGRTYHEEPEFRPLVCEAKRGYICERARGGGRGDNSTHPGWIKIGKRLFKIFPEEVDYETADNRCASHDKDSSLAVVTSFEDAQILGRYLLIGRPSLENAWIGAKWSGDSYLFQAESILLPRKTDGTTHYPPWRNDEMKKPHGCILLDRHLANTTLFVEARCSRNRALICYKFYTNASEDIHSDVIIDEEGYRLIFNKLPWKDARDYCSIKYSEYNSKLVEIREEKDVANLLYVMGENRTAVQHVWLAGYFDAIWRWDSQQDPIKTDLLNWVQNDTFSYDVESGNTCLNMDRENHIKALHYGALCSYPQAFVCWFKHEDLSRLQNDETEAFKTL